jgi:hypothetical protein
MCRFTQSPHDTYQDVSTNGLWLNRYRIRRSAVILMDEDVLEIPQAQGALTASTAPSSTKPLYMQSFTLLISFPGPPGKRRTYLMSPLSHLVKHGRSEISSSFRMHLAAAHSRRSILLSTRSAACKLRARRSRSKLGRVAQHREARRERRTTNKNLRAC